MIRQYLGVLGTHDKLIDDLKHRQSKLRKKLQALEMHFVTRGFVLNHINILRPEVPVRDARCATEVLAYFLPMPKVDDMLRKFECDFENLEMRIWKELFLLYKTRINSNVISDEEVRFVT